MAGIGTAQLCALDPFQLVIGDEHRHKSRRNDKISGIQGFDLNLQGPALFLHS
jgi:hypothetical protein